MLPAHQRLESNDATRRKFDLRLKAGFKTLVLGERKAQVLSERDSFLDNFAHSLVEEFEAAATTLLSAVKRHIGTAQQFIGIDHPNGLS